MSPGHFSRRGESLDDLVQVARIGLVQAVDRFDTSKGADFVAFAVPTMMGEVRRYFRDHGWTMHVPRGFEICTCASVERRPNHCKTSVGHQPQASLPSNSASIVTPWSIASSPATPTNSDLDAPVSDSDSDGEGRCVADTIGDLDRQLEAVTDHETVVHFLQRSPIENDGSSR